MQALVVLIRLLAYWRGILLVPDDVRSKLSYECED